MGDRALRRSRHRWAWVPLIATVALWVVVLFVIPVPGEESATDLAAAYAAVASVLGFSVIGSYLAFRLPENAVGWVLAGFGFFFSLGIVLEDAAAYARVSQSTREWLAWGGSWTWILPGSLLAVFLPLLFPDGQLPSKRWRWLPWVAVVSMVIVVLANAFGPASTAPLRNPLGLPQFAELLDLAGLIGFLIFAGCIVAAAISVVGRFRRSQGVARRQMLVFVASAVLVAFGLGASYTMYELDRPDVADLAVGVVSMTVPIAVGMAVLRYRLYDLGRIFKRSVTYTAVAVVLAGVYFIGIVALQSLLGADDSLSVAASTLAAAALFSPVRFRIQSFVDRRFDRARYDAGKVVDEFSARLSNEVDLEELHRDLAGVVNTTLRPAAVSVWVRPS